MPGTDVSGNDFGLDIRGQMGDPHCGSWNRTACGLGVDRRISVDRIIGSSMRFVG